MRRNLDREPGFWLTVLAILPFMIALEIALRAHDLITELRGARPLEKDPCDKR